MVISPLSYDPLILGKKGLRFIEGSQVLYQTSLCLLGKAIGKLVRSWLFPKEPPDATGATSTKKGANNRSGATSYALREGLLSGE